MGTILCAHPVHGTGELDIQRCADPEIQQNPLLFTTNHMDLTF